MGKHYRLVFAVLFVSTLVVALLPSVVAEENCWETKADMLEAACHYLQCAVGDGRIFVMRFYPTSHSDLSFNYEYNPSFDIWIERSPPPFYVDNPALVGFEGKIYVFGGGVVQVYDHSTDSWSTKCQMSCNRSSLDAHVVNGKIYLIGGSVPYGPDNPHQYRAVNITEIYDPAANRWTVGAPMPNIAKGYVSAAIDNKIYIITDQTQIYDCQTDTWSTGLPCLYVPLHGGAVATSGVLAPKRVYVFGGAPDGSSSYRYTQVYNPETGSWSLAAFMPVGLRDFVVGVVDDKIYIVGGCTKFFGPATNQTSLYTPIGYGNVQNQNQQQDSTEPDSSEPFALLKFVALLATICAVLAVLLFLFLRKRT
ncbi:MAG: hypothetical protein WC325_05570 [Candidatus Bathyarchaeia archaeon]|jgi:hypothetical protein